MTGTPDYEKPGIPAAERRNQAGVTAQYECLRGDVRVYTASRGPVPIKDVHPGDEVFSLNETTGELELHRVKAAAQTDVRQTYKVTIGGDGFERILHATDNHPILCLVDVRPPGAGRARWERQWKTVGELQPGDLAAVARNLPDFGQSHYLLQAIVDNVELAAPVTSIEAADVAPVYDIEIDGPHNFVAEGVIVHNSELVFQRNREDLDRLGVVFCDMDTALREYLELVKPHLGKVVPMNDNTFSALNTSVWSGGSFIYVPPGVEVDLPLQAYFRVNAENMRQFERTLIIADEGSKVHYIDGCSAPVYSSEPLHSALVEIVVNPSAHVTYTTIQNWSNNVFNLVTKRARVEAEGHMTWIDGNIGSRLTMTYPAVWLVGPKASGEVLSVAYAGAGQHQDTGAKMVHAAPETTSKIVARSISKDGGRSSYRGLVRVEDDASGCKSHVRCDALILDDNSISDTYPSLEIGARDAHIRRETTVSKVADEQLFYLMSRGLSEQQAVGMVVNGFIEPVIRTLPMEYAIEWSRLIGLQMEGSVG